MTSAAASAGPQLERFRMIHRVEMTVHRYEFFALDLGGQQGEPIAFAEQIHAALRERVTIYTDAGKSELIAAVAARAATDDGATYDVTDGAGAPIGWLRRDFGGSLLRVGWQFAGRIDLPRPGAQSLGGRSAAGVALVRAGQR